MANKVFFGKKRAEDEAMGGGGAPLGRSMASNGQAAGKLGGADPRMAAIGGAGNPMQNEQDPMQAIGGSSTMSGGAVHGMPGVQKQAGLTPEMEQLLLLQKKDQKIITEEDVHRAEGILEKYRQGKKNLERQVIENEQWWKMQHWELIKGNKDDKSP